MKKHLTKISLFILIGLIIVSCNVTKRVPDGKRLLMENKISIDDKTTTDENVFYQLYQKPNSSLPLIKYRLRLNLYNLAKKNADTSYAKWLKKNPKRHARLAKLLSEKQVQRLGKSFLVSGWSNFLMKTGEAPVLFDSLSTKKSLKRLEAYYYNKGYFDVKARYTKDTSAVKRINIKYNVALHSPYIIDSLKTSIATPVLDSLYQIKKKLLFNQNWKTIRYPKSK